MKRLDRKDPQTPIKTVVSFVRRRPIGASSEFYKEIKSVNGTTIIKSGKQKESRRVQISLYPPAIFHMSITTVVYRFIAPNQENLH